MIGQLLIFMAIVLTASFVLAGFVNMVIDLTKGSKTPSSVKKRKWLRKIK